MRLNIMAAGLFLLSDVFLCKYKFELCRCFRLHVGFYSAIYKYYFFFFRLVFGRKMRRINTIFAIQLICLVVFFRYMRIYLYTRILI